MKEKSVSVKRLDWQDTIQMREGDDFDFVLDGRGLRIFRSECGGLVVVNDLTEEAALVS